MRWSPEGALTISYRAAFFWHLCPRFAALVPPKPAQTKERMKDQTQPSVLSGCQLLLHCAVDTTSSAASTQWDSSAHFFGNRATISNHNFRIFILNSFLLTVKSIAKTGRCSFCLELETLKWKCIIPVLKLSSDAVAVFAAGSRHLLRSASSVHSYLFRLFVM